MVGPVQGGTSAAIVFARAVQLTATGQRVKAARCKGVALCLSCARRNNCCAVKSIRAECRAGRRGGVVFE